MDSGDIAWILISSALVLFMTPGLALVYGGMVRAKNVLNMLMMNFFTISIVTVVWILVGWTIAFGGDGGGLVGDFGEAGLAGLSGEGLLFPMFQLTFAIITPALIDCRAHRDRKGTVGVGGDCQQSTGDAPRPR